MYTLDGGLTQRTTNPPVPGYRRSRPVQIGNDATGQVQLGIYGDLFETVAGWVFAGHVLDTATSRELADLADRCADRWRHRDAGIWELHDAQHYTSSKMNCWRALTRAAELAEAGHISGPAGRWRAEADAVRGWIDEHCWSQRKQSYTFYAGTDHLDASVLLAAKFGFDRGARMSSTIDALRHELAAGPLLYRYTGADQEEATFVACAYWTVEALALVGRTDEADSLMRDLDGLGNDVGLLSEMAEPGSFALIGNTPQALSHLAHIGAAFALRAAASDDTEEQT
ncbi:glycoside hydrolase family 15 protein [Jatrophihabitans endophyticus]|uniref:glycoside hydrolase family 15 protein n=1 Tax=Jatrophihabitans endophyticus TaxID=1206085 RepID=UPI0019FAA8AC|nr:glycoside hydrolase family 15 protein [Jatrophihabitans endophyticus]MBE7190610.1 glycoside hydrolase family 15 protein [Jatrophihabitans endophyticus]